MRNTPATLVGGALLVVSAILVALAIAFSAADPELTYSSEIIDNSRDIQVTCTDDVSDGRGRQADAPLLDAGDHLRTRYTVLRGELELTQIARDAAEKAVPFSVQRGINADCAAARADRVRAATQALSAAVVAALLAIGGPALLRRRATTGAQT